MLHRRGRARVILHRAHAGVEIEHLAQSDVQRADASAHGRRERPFDGDAKFAQGVDGVVGKPGVELGHGLFAGEHFVPHDAALAAVGFLHRRIEDADRGLPDVAAGAIAFDEGNERVVGYLVLSVAVSYSRAVFGHRRSRCMKPPCDSSILTNKTANYKAYGVVLSVIRCYRWSCKGGYSRVSQSRRELGHLFSR